MCTQIIHHIKSYNPKIYSWLSGWSQNVPGHEQQKSKVQQQLGSGGAFPDLQESRAIATMLGMACGDALGHTLEFLPVRYNTPVSERVINNMMGGGKFRLSPGQWTDDCSMGLCLADSLLFKDSDTVDPYDLMLRFEIWWHFGYNNAFGNDVNRNNKCSVGLGGNISHALRSFLTDGKAATTAGDKMTSGNGSIMRLAAVPIKYWREPLLACAVAHKQSVVTHQGEEAAECARLLAFICTTGIQNSRVNQDSSSSKCIAQELLDSIGAVFETTELSVACLAQGQAEGNDPDRQWTWRQVDYQYSPTRATNQPGYVGSYAMDGLAMAMHCVYSTFTFKEAVLKCVNMAGDADTVGAITGQIAGSIYGCESIPLEWIQSIQQWDNGGDIACKASLLYHMRENEVVIGKGICVL